MRLLTQAEVDAAMVGHDPDGNKPLMIWNDVGHVRVFGENGLVTLHVCAGDDDAYVNLSESECRKLAAVLIRLADIWCVS